MTRGVLGIQPSEDVLQPMPVGKAVSEAINQTYRLTALDYRQHRADRSRPDSLKQIGGPFGSLRSPGSRRRSAHCNSFS